MDVEDSWDRGYSCYRCYNCYRCYSFLFSRRGRLRTRTVPQTLPRPLPPPRKRGGGVCAHRTPLAGGDAYVHWTPLGQGAADSKKKDHLTFVKWSPRYVAEDGIEPPTFRL